MVDRVGDLAEQARKVRLPRHARVGAHHGPVGLVLRHAHVLHLRIQPRHAARGRKGEQVAAEQILFLTDHDLRQRPAVRGEDLIQLHLIPLALRPVRVEDLDLRKLAAQQLQSQQRRPAHVAEADEREDEAVLLRRAPCLQDGKRAGKRCIQYARAVRAHECRQFPFRRGRRGQAADALGLVQLR